MNPAQTTPPPQKKGLSGLAIAGMGCGVLLLLAGVATVLLLIKGCKMAGEMAADFQKNPSKAAAMLMVKANPDLELVSTDDAKGEITIRSKSDGQQLTLSFDDLAKGKFTVRNEKDEVITVDGSQASAEGTVTMKTPDGEMVIGGGQVAPPAWVPAYPGARSLTGGIRSTQGDKVFGTAVSETSDPVAQVREFFEPKLKAEGYELSVSTSQADGVEALVLGGKLPDGSREVSLMAQQENGKTSLVLTYAEKTEKP